MVRPLTQQLFDCLILDTWPGIACVTDFGIGNDSKKYRAFQWVIKNGLVTMEELDQALGDGPKLTEIVSRGGSPHACKIETPYDM